jgi:hypothetical protein
MQRSELGLVTPHLSPEEGGKCRASHWSLARKLSPFSDRFLAGGYS